MAGLFGIPLPIIGFICFLLAGLFIYVWPKAKAGSKRGLWTNFMLHYFHPLALVLLGMAAFLQNRDVTTAIVTAVIGGVFYLIFLVLWARDSIAG